MIQNEIPGKLKAIQVKQSKPSDKVYKMSDGKGLNLEIHPNGSKYWRLSYRFQKKQKTLALGVSPVVTLAKAREKMLDAKRNLDAGIDPGIVKKHNKATAGQDTFELVAKEWFTKESEAWKKSHADKVWQSIKSGALPHLRNMQMSEITTRDVLYLVRNIEERGALDVAARVKQRISAIFRYAIQVGYAENNPVDALKDVLKVRKVQHRMSIKLDELPVYLEALDRYSGYPVTRYALEFIAHTFVRPGELRSAEWKDIDLDKAIWRIPAEKMKMNEEHLVPLSNQIIALLNKVKVISGSYELVFPSTYDRQNLMSENTLTYAIRKRLKFDATAHGFRTTASTVLNESGFRVDVIERQLAHGERNKVRAAYNRSQYLAERAEMMQWYSDYLDEVKAEVDVRPISRIAK
jgi:integrase